MAELPATERGAGGFGSTGVLIGHTDADAVPARSTLHTKPVHSSALHLMRWPFFKPGVFFPANEIAVDLGTANTLVYVKGEGIVLNEPSVVAIERATGKIKGIGLEAKRMLGPHARRHHRGAAAEGRRHRRLRCDREDAPLLPEDHHRQARLPREAAGDRMRALGDHGGGAARGARFGAAAGAKQVMMVAEPMAAAIGVGLPVETPTGNMVIDIGGGTTEIAVIALSGIVSDTSIRTGGDELDQAIVQFMRKNYNLLVGEPTAEAIKIKIGSAAPVGEEREMEVKGRDLVSGIPKTVRVHSSEIREACRSLSSRSSTRCGARWRSRRRSWRATSSTAAS